MSSTGSLTSESSQRAFCTVVLEPERMFKDGAAVLLFGLRDAEASDRGGKALHRASSTNMFDS